jgi:hypothetical protein
LCLTVVLQRFPAELLVVPRMGPVSVSASRMYLRRGQSDERERKYDYFTCGHARHTGKGSLVGVSFPPDIEYGWRTRPRWSSDLYRLACSASPLDTNGNPLFSGTDSAGIPHRTRSSALSSSLADAMGLGASVLNPVCFIHPSASPLGWSIRALFRVGLSARAWLLCPARSHTAFLRRSIICPSRLPEEHNPKAKGTT